jgi:3-oxoadipate enol-lactonase
VIAGEEDILIPLRLSRALADAIPGASLLVIPEAGHSVNIEQTAAFNAALDRFLQSVSG